VLGCSKTTIKGQLRLRQGFSASGKPRQDAYILSGSLQGSLPPKTRPPYHRLSRCWHETGFLRGPRTDTAAWFLQSTLRPRCDDQANGQEKPEQPSTFASVQFEGPSTRSVGFPFSFFPSFCSPLCRTWSTRKTRFQQQFVHSGYAYDPRRERSLTRTSVAFTCGSQVNSQWGAAEFPPRHHGPDCSFVEKNISKY